MTHNFPLPNNLIEVLHDFIHVIMVKKPINYMQFAAKYFSKLSNNRSLDLMELPVESVSISVANSTDSIETGDDDDDGNSNRRKSVAAEKIDPEDMEDEELKIEIHPKTDQQRLRLKQVCEAVAMFRSLTLEDIMLIIDAMYSIEVKPGQVIIQEGDEGDNFYIIESGTYEAFINQGGEPRKIKTYNNEGNFGELALIYNALRAATIKASSEGVIWAVTRQVFRSVVLVKAHKQREVYNKLLEGVPMLAPLSAHERANIADALTSRECLQNEKIIQEGEPGSNMFFIITGEIEISKMNGNKKQVITILKPGKYFGELALLSNQPRAASAMAVKLSTLAVLDVKSFERLMGPCIEVMKRNLDDYKKQVVDLFKS